MVRYLCMNWNSKRYVFFISFVVVFFSYLVTYITELITESAGAFYYHTDIYKVVNLVSIFIPTQIWGRILNQKLYMTLINMGASLVSFYLVIQLVLFIRSKLKINKHAKFILLLLVYFVANSVISRLIVLPVHVSSTDLKFVDEPTFISTKHWDKCSGPFDEFCDACDGYQIKIIELCYGEHSYPHGDP